MVVPLDDEFIRHMAGRGSILSDDRIKYRVDSLTRGIAELYGLFPFGFGAP